LGTPEPLSSPIAFLISTGAEESLVTKEKERSAYTVMTTGNDITDVIFCAFVELFVEGHNVDTMLSKRRAYRGAELLCQRVSAACVASNLLSHLFAPPNYVVTCRTGKFPVPPTGFPKQIPLKVTVQNPF
jgi:hypothetical protein